MRHFFLRIQKTEFIFFLFIMFVFKMPPIYLPILSFLTSHNAAKLILAALFFINFLFRNNFRAIFKEKIFLFFALFFATQSLSVITITDIASYLRGYQNLITHLMLFSLTYFFVRKNTDKKIYQTSLLIVYVVIAAVILQTVFLLFQESFLNTISTIVNKGLFDLYVYNFLRGRLYLYLNVEIFTIFLLFFAEKAKDIHINKRLLVILIACIIFFAFLSNFRRPIVLVSFQLVCYGMYFVFAAKKTLYKHLLKVLTGVCVVSILGILVSQSLYNFHILDRFSLENKSEDVESITYRIDSFYKTVDIGLKNPFIGIGLGQYSYYTNPSPLAYFDYGQEMFRNVYVDTKKNPHSLISLTIAETGILGLLSLMSLLTYFFVRDLMFLKRTTKLTLIYPFLISFWTLFLYSLFSPFDNIYVSAWFWFLRGIIEAVYSQTHENTTHI